MSVSPTPAMNGAETEDLYVTVIESRSEVAYDMYVQLELDPWDIRTGVVRPRHSTPPQTVPRLCVTRKRSVQK